MNNKYQNWFEGTGAKLKDRGESLPDYEPFAGKEDAKKYIAPEGLRHAVNVALLLGQPLLVTGEPGTGKTRLAAAVAWELDLPLLEFHTKTTSTAADLFYQYDAIRRFQDAHGKAEKDISDYVTCEALGAAILLSNPVGNARKILPKKYRDREPTRSVVLIDEIDKAPRDLPNDVLNEVERMRFEIRETDWEPFEADEKLRPVLILTSNSEKNLPDAFLRRCAFYHITFPERDKLIDIIRKRFESGEPGDPGMPETLIENAADHFLAIRDIGLRKKPATAECIAWISALRALDLNLSEMNDAMKKKLVRTYSVLAKSKSDFDRMSKWLATN